MDAYKEMIVENILNGKDMFRLSEDEDLWFRYKNNTLYLIGYTNHSSYVIYYEPITKRYLMQSAALKKLDRFVKCFEKCNFNDKFLIQNCLPKECFSDLC